MMFIGGVPYPPGCSLFTNDVLSCVWMGLGRQPDTLMTVLSCADILWPQPVRTRGAFIHLARRAGFDCFVVSGNKIHSVCLSRLHYNYKEADTVKKINKKNTRKKKSHSTSAIDIQLTTTSAHLQHVFEELRIQLRINKIILPTAFWCPRYGQWGSGM